MRPVVEERQLSAAEPLRLHAALYTGMLAEYKKADIPYVPHIMLGAVTPEPARLIQAFDEAGKLHLDSSSVVDRVDSCDVTRSAR